MANYVTKQAILEEAGLLHRVLGEVASGVTDGTNKTFVAGYKPIADSNYDEVVNSTDVTVYVNGSPVGVAGLTPGSGAVVLSAAPAAGSVVTLDYSWQNVPDSYIAQIRDEAAAFVNDSMDGVDPTPYSTVPFTIRKITRYYAAGLALIRDYGFNSNSEGTSKDGAMKIKMAEKWLADYIGIGGSTGLSFTGTDVAVMSDDPVFPTSLDQPLNLSPDDLFMANYDL